MAITPLQKNLFISFDEKFNILSEDIDKNARFVFNITQKYFIKGNPSPEVKNIIFQIIENLNKKKEIKA